LSQLNRDIIFCFQPGEEGKGGAKLLIENHPQLLKNVDHCFAIHSANNNPAGYVSIGMGNISANSSRFEIKIKGKGCHVMLAEHAVDANLIGCNLVTQIYNLKSLKLSPL
jgi:metal-dependent amidase/aminoacylase/carboxypeptidase family protein